MEKGNDLKVKMNDSSICKFDLGTLQRDNDTLPSLADLQSGQLYFQQNSNLFYLVSPLVLGCTLLSLVDIQSDRPELPSLKTFQSSENVDYEPEEEKVTIEMF